MPEIMTLALVLILIFLPRIWILFNSSYTFYSDDAIYAILAQSWLEGNWQYIFHPTWPPLYPTISALFLYIISNVEISQRLVSLIFGTIIFIPLFYLLRKTTSLIEAVFFVISLSLFTSLLTLSLLPLSDSLAIFLIILGLVLVFFALINSSSGFNTKFLLLSSFIFGLTYLTRSEGTMFFFLSLLYLFFYGVIKCRTKKYFLVIVYFILIFFVTISPYVIATRFQIEEWSLSHKFSAQLQQGHSFSLNKRNTTWSQEVVSAKFPNYKSPYYKNGTKYLLDRLYSLMHLYPEKQLKWQGVFLSIFPFWMVPFMLIGVVYLFNKKYIWSINYLCFILITAIPITIFSTPMQDIRYMAWVIPIFLFLFLLGIKILVKNNYISAFLLFMCVLFFPGTSIENIFNPNKIARNFTQFYDKNELKMAGLWIKEHTLHPIPKIMMRHEGVEFYSGGQTIYIPQISYEEVLKYAKQNNVDFIVAWDKELMGDKVLIGLLNSDIKHPGLKKVYNVKGRNNIIIYKPI